MNVSVRGATMEAPASSDSDEPPATLLATLHELRCARQISVNDVAFDSVDEWKLVKEEGDWRTVCALCTTGKRRQYRLNLTGHGGGYTTSQATSRETRFTHVC